VQEATNIITGILGASTILAGILLGGFLFPESISAGTKPDRIQRSGNFCLLFFVASLAVLGVTAACFIFPSDFLFWSSVIAFALLSVSIATAGGVVLLRSYETST
jgi:hypothetical protein